MDINTCGIEGGAMLASSYEHGSGGEKPAAVFRRGRNLVFYNTPLLFMAQSETILTDNLLLK